MPFVPALSMMLEEIVSVFPASTETESVPFAVPPAVSRPAPEIVVAVAELISPPPRRLSVRDEKAPRSTVATSVRLKPRFVVVPAFVSV